MLHSTSHPLRRVTSRAPARESAVLTGGDLAGPHGHHILQSLSFLASGRAGEVDVSRAPGIAPIRVATDN